MWEEETYLASLEPPASIDDEPVPSLGDPYLDDNVRQCVVWPIDVLKTGVSLLDAPRIILESVRWPYMSLN